MADAYPGRGLVIEIICTVLFSWLFIKVFGPVIKAAWGITKMFASTLLVLALPAMIVCVIFAGGILLLVPIGILGLAFATVNI